MDSIIKLAIERISKDISSNTEPIDVLVWLEKHGYLCSSELIKQEIRIDFINMLDDKVTKESIYIELSEKYCLSYWTVKKYTLGL